MSVRISAVICTYNRAEYLRKALKSLLEQTLCIDLFEIIVVDNGSKDHTREVVDEYSDTANLRYIEEPRLGLSYARNTGWQKAEGEYVAYMDDDAVASPRWLEKILEVFQNVKPTPGCVGGKIDPIWEAPRPSWLPDEKLGDLAILNWSDKPVVLNERQWVAGANMSFPRRLLEEAGGFQIGIARTGNRLLAGEDVLLERQLVQKGYNCFYHPELLVRHHVSASRLTKSWFMKRAYWQGVSDAFISIHKESPAFSRRLYKGMCALMRILLSPRDLTSLVMSSNDPRRFSLRCSVLARIGCILTLWGILK